MANYTPRGKKSTQPKKDPYFIYKVLTKYLLEPNEARLQKLCENKQEADKLRNRALIYLQAFPEIISKIDKYANGSYETTPIISKFTNEEWFQFYAHLIKAYNITNSRQFYMPKFNLNEYCEFIKNMKKYLDQVKADVPSSQELSCLFVLYKQGILPENIFDELIIDNEQAGKRKPTTNNNISMVDFNFNVSANTKSTRQNNYESLSDDIKALLKEALMYMRSPHSDCKKCELNNNLKIMLDTNINNRNDGVDILFIGLNSTLDDKENGIPMNNKKFGPFRDFLDITFSKFPKFKFACMNLLQCAVINESEFKPDSCLTKCKKVVTIMINTLKPKLIVTFGDKPMKYFGIKGTVNKNNNTIIPINPGHVLPTVLPIVGMTEKNKKLFEAAWQTILQFLEKLNVEKQTNSTSTADFKIDESKIITRITPDLTIFDIKEINNKHVFIFKTKDNKKVYYIDDIKVPVYIKFGQYRDCDLITKEMDQVAYLSAFELAMLNKKLYEDMIKMRKTLTK